MGAVRTDDPGLDHRDTYIRGESDAWLARPLVVHEDRGVYGGKKNDFWMSSAYGTDVVRLDAFWFFHNAGDPRERFFRGLWEALEQGLLAPPRATQRWPRSRACSRCQSSSIVAENRSTASRWARHMRMARAPSGVAIQISSASARRTVPS